MTNKEFKNLNAELTSLNLQAFDLELTINQNLLNLFGNE